MYPVAFCDIASDIKQNRIWWEWNNMNMYMYWYIIIHIEIKAEATLD